jgi:hypothetical protein
MSGYKIRRASELKAKIAAIRSDQKSAFNNASHAGHKTAVAEIRKMYDALFEGTTQQPAEMRARTRARSRVGSTPQQLIAWVIRLFQDGEEAETDFENESRHFISCALGNTFQLGKFTARDWKALRTDVASGFRQAALREDWILPSKHLTGHEHIAAVGRTPFQGPPRALFLLACERLLSLPDGHRLKVCSGSDCERLFLRQKRQTFCSTKCLRNERDRRTRQALTPEKLRARRHRYYVNRVAKLKGKTVAGHVQERPRQASESGNGRRRAHTIAWALAIAEKRPALRTELAAFLNECSDKRSLREHIDGRYEHCIGIYRTKKSAVAEGPGLECVQDALVDFGGSQSRFPRSLAQNLLLEKIKRSAHIYSDVRPGGAKYQRQKTSAATSRDRR